jgi:O-antigen/teichoic acid export membrane protein
VFNIKKNNFTFQTIEFAVIDLISKLFKVLFIPVLAYFIEKELLGELSLVFALIPFISLGIGLNIPNFFRHIVLKRPNEIANFFSTFLIYSFTPLIIGILICLCISEYYYLLILLISYIFNILLAYNFYLLGIDNRYLYLKETLIINTIIYCSSILIIYFFVDEFNNIFSLLMLLLITSIFSLIYTIIKLIKLKLLNLKFVSRTSLNYLIKKNIPLIFHGLSGFGLIYADRFFLKYYFNNDVVANYTVIYSYTLIFSFILVSINNNVIPKYYKLLEHQSEKKKLEKNIIFFLLLSLLLAFPIYYIASILVPNNIDFNIWTFFIICMSYFFISVYNIKANILLFKEKTFLIAFLSLIALSFNVILNIFFIPRYGEIGAAFSTLISYIILSILYFFKTRKYAKDISAV